MMIKKCRVALIGLVLTALLTSLGFIVTVQRQSEEVLSIWMRRDPDSVQPVIDAYNARLKTAGKPFRLNIRRFRPMIYQQNWRKRQHLVNHLISLG